MSGNCQSRPWLLVLATALLAIGCGGQTGVNEVRGLDLVRLDPADPAQEALIRWHRALVDDDFAAYAETDFHAVGASEKLRRLVFDTIRPGMPNEILVNDGTGSFDALMPAKDGDTLAGVRLLTLVGCVLVPGSAMEERRTAVVHVRELDGLWKVGGASFGPPNQYTEGLCPMATETGEADSVSPSG